MSLEVGDQYVAPEDPENPHAGHTITVVAVAAYAGGTPSDPGPPERSITARCECSDETWTFVEAP